jgi:hypothetical protein
MGKGQRYGILTTDIKALYTTNCAMFAHAVWLYGYRLAYNPNGGWQWLKPSCGS